MIQGKRSKQQQAEVGDGCKQMEVMGQAATGGWWIQCCERSQQQQAEVGDVCSVVDGSSLMTAIESGLHLEKKSTGVAMRRLRLVAIGL